MAYRLRPHNPQDYHAMAHIAGLCQPPPTSGEQMAESDRLSLMHPTAQLRRTVAEDEDSVIMGYSLVRLGGWIPDGQSFARVYTDPVFRRQGVGGALYNDAAEWLAAHAIHTVESTCTSDDDETFRWALRRGFVLERQRMEAVLDLNSFIDSAFSDRLKEVEAAGIRLVISQRPQDDMVLRDLFQTEIECWPDVPGFDGNLPEYEAWHQQMSQGRNPLVYALAYDGGTVVGFSQMQIPAPGGNEAYTGFTAVRRAYRGRGIALALKVQTIRQARILGLTSMKTHNDADNPAMLAVNRRLGYRSAPGPRVLRRGPGAS